MKTKITLLIGHRGVGKTSLLTRLKKYARQLKIVSEFIDLDNYIEKEVGLSIDNIFQKQGEEKFRGYERKYLKSIVLMGLFI